MKPFTLLIEQEVITFVEGLSPRGQRTFHRRMHDLCDKHVGYSREHVHDSEGRIVNVTIVDDYLLKYWIDADDRQIKVLHIKRA